MPINVDDQCLSNIRLELQQIIETLRHYNLLYIGITAFLIPATTIGFSVKISDNEFFVLCLGIGSILSWFLFYIIRITFIKNEFAETMEYGNKLCEILKNKVDHEDNGMRIMEVLQTSKINFGTFMDILGLFICAGWIIYLIKNNLFCFCN